MVLRGSGPWLDAADGRRYFDATAGSGAILLGHQHPDVIAAAQAQVAALVHTGCKINSAPRAAFVEALGRIAPFERCAVLPSVIGTEAVESALKIARAYTGRRSVVAFDFAYHGKSAGALALTWRRSFKPYSVLDEGQVLVAPHPSFRAARDPELRAAALQRLREVLERAREQGSPPAAIILEPIQVTEGVHDPGPDFIRGVIELAHEHGALAILDEIYTGVGRCGHLFYADRLAGAGAPAGPGALPDLLIVGKSLGNGFPISAVLGPEEIVNALPPGVQTSTYSGGPVACAAASAVIEIVTRRRVWEASRQVGERAQAALRELAAGCPFIVDVRGEGTLLAFDLVTPEGAPAPRLATAFVERAQAHGVLLFKGGREEASIKIVPPALLEADAERFLYSALAEVAHEVAHEVRDAVP